MDRAHPIRQVQGVAGTYVLHPSYDTRFDPHHRDSPVGTPHF